MYLFLILISAVGILSAIGQIRKETNARKKALNRWKQFEENHPKKEL